MWSGMHPSMPPSTLNTSRLQGTPLERMRRLNTLRQHLDCDLFDAHCASSECDATTAESEMERTGHDKS
jgi:hypothetical protein